MQARRMPPAAAYYAVRVSSEHHYTLTNIHFLIRPHRRVKQCGTRTRVFNGPFSRTTRVSRYQKGRTNLDFTEARDSEWQWYQLGHMQVLAPDR